MSHLTPPTPSTAPTVTITRLNAKTLREWRERSGLTQDDLADALGLARRTVQRMESGSRSITKLHTLALRGLEALSQGQSNAQVPPGTTIIQPPPADPQRDEGSTRAMRTT